MRVTFNMQYQQGLGSIISSQDKLATANLKLANQTKILTPADDPSGAARVAGLEQNINKTDQYQSSSNSARSSLELQETVLSSVRNAMDRARTLTLSLGNGTFSDQDRQAVGEQLEDIRDELFDLMNRKDELGGYLFSGFKDQTQSYSLNSSTGLYEFNGDEGQKALQVSSAVTVTTNDSGKSIFEGVTKRLQTTAATTTGPVTGASVSVSNQSVFDGYYRQNYDGITAANNDFSVVFSAPSNYEIMRNGASLSPAVTGTYTAGEPISFHGLQINAATAAAGGQIDFSLKPPQTTNILDSLTSLVNAISSGQTGDVLNTAVLDATAEIDAASQKVDSAMASVGGRINILKSIFGSNEDLLIAAKSQKADISELDYATGITELMKHETALQAAQATFTKISGLSLFNYI